MLKIITVAAALAFGAITAASANDAFSNAEYGIANQNNGQWNRMDNIFASTRVAPSRHGATVDEMHTFQDPYEAAEYNLSWGHAR